MRFRFLFSLLVAALAGSDLPAQNTATNLTINLRVAGSSIVDSKGALAGNVESVVLDPRTSQIHFAMVSTEYPSNRFEVTPIPWQMIQYRWDARAAGGVPGTFQQFVVPVDRLVVSRAPRINSEKRAQTNDLEWMTASYNYFRSVIGGVGAASASSGTETGGASAQAVATPVPVAAEGGVYPIFFGGGGFAPGVGSLQDFLILGTNLFGSNFLSDVLGTNFFATNTAGTNFLSSTNFFNSLTNFLATNGLAFTNFGTNTFAFSNLFRTNFFALTNNSGTNPFTNAVSTNMAGRGFPNSNFISGGFSNVLPVLPATNRGPLPPTAAGAPPSGSGVSTPGTPTTPARPNPPAPPSAPRIRTIPRPAPVAPR